MVKAPLAITGCALLTPLEMTGAGEAGGAAGAVGGGTVGRREGTWKAIRAGKRVRACRAVADGLLPGEALLDRSIRIGMAVAQRAAAGRELGPETSLFCGTSKGPVGTLLAISERLRGGGCELLAETEALQCALGVGAMGAFVAEALNLTGAVHTSVAACASGVHALHRAAGALWRDECGRALVVAADASLQALFEGSFRRLGVLSASGECTPFGPNGEGFFVTEAGAALVLEKGSAAGGRSGGDVLAWLEESWIGGDGTGLIAVDPTTAALRQGLQACAGPAREGRAGDGPALGFIHAHATGTGHDRYEREAIGSIAGEGVPVFSSKGALGHSLGAAGLVSVALSVESHMRGETMGGEKVGPRARSLTIAQGFGGSIGIVRLRGR